MSQVNPIPDSYQRVTPYLSVDGAADAIDFYTRIFDARERMRMDAPGGKVGHAEIAIGDSVIMLADPPEDGSFRDATSLGGSPVLLVVYVEDVDAVVDRAVAAGATLQRPVEDQFYGDRMGEIVDPFGQRWSVMTHVEDVSPDEMERRVAAMSS